MGVTSFIKAYYSEAAWTFTEAAFVGILGYNKSIRWIEWWPKNRAIRQSYNALLDRMAADAAAMAKVRKSEKEIAERVVTLLIRHS